MENFVVAVGICLAILTFGSAVPQCHLAEVFTCMDKPVDFMNSLPRRSLPKTDDDVGKLCKAMGEGITCLDDYRDRCMTPMQREFLALSNEGALELRNKFCGSSASKERTDYLTHAECLNKVTQGEGTNNNLRYLLAIAERFLNLPNSERLNFLCCGYAKMYHKIRSEAVNTCGEEAAQAGDALVQLAIAQFPNMLCTGFDGNSEECTKVLPPDGAKPTDEFGENPVYKFFYNLIKNYLE